jgi:hypothetical protein
VRAADSDAFFGAMWVRDHRCLMCGAACRLTKRWSGPQKPARLLLTQQPRRLSGPLNLVVRRHCRCHRLEPKVSNRSFLAYRIRVAGLGRVRGTFDCIDGAGSRRACALSDPADVFDSGYFVPAVCFAAGDRNRSCRPDGSGGIVSIGSRFRWSLRLVVRHQPWDSGCIHDHRNVVGHRPRSTSGGSQWFRW